MKLKNLLTLQAVVALAYGVCFVVLTRTVLSLHGITQGPGEVLLGRDTGVQLIAIGLLAWLARNVTDSDAKRAILIAFLVSDIIGLIVSILGTLSGAMNAVGWTAVVVYLFFVLAYAYFLFAKADTS